MKRITPFLLCLVLGTLGPAGCGGEDPECDGAVIEASLEALDFGDLALGGVRGQEGDGQVPERRTVFFRNRCGAPLVVEKACVVNAGHNGDPATPAFFVEFEPASVRQSQLNLGGIRPSA